MKGLTSTAGRSILRISLAPPGEQTAGLGGDVSHRIAQLHRKSVIASSFIRADLSAYDHAVALSKIGTCNHDEVDDWL